jgi:16S rRNA C967 or C1407 C5-methylase (RsmB/RsmF family)
MKRKLSKEDKKLRDRFKTVSRLLEAEEYEQLMASIKKERLLKQRIAELSRYRRNGITKLEGAGVHRESEWVKTCCYLHRLQ